MHNPSSLFRPGRQRCATEHEDDRDRSLGDIQKLCLEIREAERGDDQVGEDTQPADDQGRSDLEQHVAPDHRVGHGFYHLVALVRLVLDAGLVGADTLDHETLLVLVEALRGHGRVGEPPPDEQAPDAGCDAQDEEKELP